MIPTDETAVPDPGSLLFDDRGLVPAVVQQHDTGEVLMLAWMDRAAVEETLAGGEAVYWSRSRQERWHKGATSGDTQRVVEVRVDCDADAVLVLVDQQGRGACHTGERSCFGRRLGHGEAVPGGAATPPAPPTWSRDHTATPASATPATADPTAVPATEEPNP